MKTNIVERKIMWGDLDPMGIVFYPRYYEWMDAGSHLFFESIGLDLNILSKQRQLGFGLNETSCIYSNPGRYHQTVRIITQLEEVNEKTVKLKHLIYDASDDELLVTGVEKRICMDVSKPENIRAIAIPEEIHSILKNAIDC
ncbi:MAG: acyl-CoA thioesterase [Proteobacteria bacterium]|nr:acyl-CoA thioesterase [Pseudomonadota bacterium]